MPGHWGVCTPTGLALWLVLQRISRIPDPPDLLVDGQEVAVLLPRLVQQVLGGDGGMGTEV